MNFEQLTETHKEPNNREWLALVPGRFQPPHNGHIQMWKWMKREFGDAIVVTSDKVDLPNSPFNFDEKQTLFKFAGLPESAVQQVTSPYRPNEVVSQYNVDEITLLFAVSEKDMDSDPRFRFTPKRDGTPSYFQPYEGNEDNLQTPDVHAYVVVVPTFEYSVIGQPLKSATELRTMFAAADYDMQAEMIQDLYGSYDADIHQLLKGKLG